MKYGSTRFSDVVSNNINILELGDVEKPTKIVVGKDVVLILPRDPNKILPWEAYPTHQESWLPLWFIAIYHSKAITEEEKEYQEELSRLVPKESRNLLKTALLKKAKDFLKDYYESVDEPRKKFKKLTRLAQDILLYLDAEDLILDHDEYLENSEYCNLIMELNKLRAIKIENLSDIEVQNKIKEIETEISSKLDIKINEVGNIEDKYEELQKKLTQNGEIFVIKDPVFSIEEYVDLIAKPYDLELGEDAHDLDAMAIREFVKNPRFCQIFDFRKNRRIDMMVISKDLKEFDVIEGGKESFQPISFMILTHATPKTEDGINLQERLKKEIMPKDIAEHYLGGAKDFFDGDGYGKSYIKRRETDLPTIKKVIPLHRIARDLLARAIYMLKTNEFCCGVNDEDLFKIGETEEFAKVINHLFETQAEDITQEELDNLAKRIGELLLKYYKKEYSDIYKENLNIMSSENIDIKKGLKVR